ncbi:MAG TPA: hypothetical protein VMF12_07310 [Xanthobacteraceae bacterium]|nr:hypothetical protein [Xanthobacteraceae bacterium]
MHVNDLLGTKNLAAETGDAVLAKFDDGEKLELNETISACGARGALHVDHIGRAYVVADSAARTLFKLDIFDHRASKVVAGH